MKRFWAALALVAATAASAEQMMPAGPSPDSGFAGVWRIVDARPAPWTKPRKLARADAPLLEFAVAFNEGAIKGPAPLACASAHYSSGDSDYFGGRLSRDASGAMARALNLAQGGVTYRTVCAGAVRDYYMDDHADLVMAEADVIYTLRRPDGMGADQIQPGFSGPSFDCTRAKSAAEQFLCSDANLAETDRKLSVAYARLKRTETPESFATVQAAQRGWLAYVLKTCGANGTMPDDQGDKNKISECLSDNYGDRADRLHAIAVVKSGALVLEPRMRFFSRPKPATEDSDIYPWIVGNDAFNAFAAKKLALAKRRMDDKKLFPFAPDQVGDLKLSARRTYDVARFDDRIASIQIGMFDYTGGAHEAIGEDQINWDMRRARPFTPADVFRADKDWKRFVTDYCLADLKKQFQGQQDSGPDRGDVAKVVAGGSWLFAKDHAIVHFTVYSITSFSGGEHEVEIPYSALKPYVKADAPFL